jgi:hypothetical protein
MASSAQLLANQANAQLSTGPRTEEGRQRAKLNSLRHGLTGQVHTFTPEDREAFDKHCNGIRESLGPVGAFEVDLAQSIAEDRWRLNRARAIEGGIFALGQFANVSVPGGVEAPDLHQARTWLADGRNLQLLTLYESRIQRSIDKAFAQLTILQVKREAAHQKAMDEALLLAQLDHMKGQKYEPERDSPPEPPPIGSVFSAAAINQALARDYRLGEAKFYSRNAWDLTVRYCRPDLRLPQAA